MKELESLDAAFIIDTFLLLLIGIGPKIALVPFLDATADMPEATKRRVLRKMLTTAATVAAVLLILGGLLTRLLHFSPGALGISSGIILLVIALAMVPGHHADGGDHSIVTQIDGTGRSVRAQDGTETRYDAATVLWTVGVAAPPVAAAIAQPPARSRTGAGGSRLAPTGASPAIPRSWSPAT